MTKIVIIDDHSVVRIGLKFVMQLDRSLKLAGEAENGKTGIELVKREKPDLAIVDISLPDISGLEVLQRIRTEAPDVKVVMLTTSDKEEDVLQSINNGARGYVLKDTPPEEMVKAFHTVADGGEWFPKAVLETYELGRSSRRLSSRELDVLKLMERGLSNPDIAPILNISVNSVKMHVKHIFEKLEVEDRAEAISVALRRGILK